MPPGPDSHKYTRGMVAVVAGAMPGAAALAATAAAHAGTGYVLLLGSATDRLPHAIVRRRYDAAALDDPRIGVIVIGPGLGRDDKARERLDAALATPHPLVIDGDALHLLDLDRLRQREASAIVTPHAGEFSSLFGEGHGSKIDRARAAAKESGATIVFKGADTVISRPDGYTWVSAAKAPWLSTAGTGDVLVGTIAAQLVANERDPFGAAGAGVWLHSEAARLLGPAFIADDLAAALPRALSQCL